MTISRGITSLARETSIDWHSASGETLVLDAAIYATLTDAQRSSLRTHRSSLHPTIDYVTLYAYAAYYQSFVGKLYKRAQLTCCQ